MAEDGEFSLGGKGDGKGMVVDGESVDDGEDISGADCQELVCGIVRGLSCELRGGENSGVVRVCHYWSVVGVVDGDDGEAV